MWGIIEVGWLKNFGDVFKLHEFCASYSLPVTKMMIKVIITLYQYHLIYLKIKLSSGLCTLMHSRTAALASSTLLCLVLNISDNLCLYL